MTMGLRHAWDRFSLYLPVLLMGLLALGTWWLVRNAPQVQVPRPASAPRHEPDY
ncbi:MAG: LPS export ABC transporter periplasmic protein LptC, partial [Giesbergeria sp.]|nr:LPS export ABC transporter periplasmic protein LptC [Giesbergeria sp.]